MGIKALVIDVEVLGLIMSILTAAGERFPDMVASSLHCHLPALDVK
jgi:hypothetical protein